MKICLVVSDFAPRLGGIATFNNGLAAALASNEKIERVQVIVFQGNAERQEEISPKIFVHYFPRKNILQMFFVLLKEFRTIRGYAVLHSPNVFPMGFFSVLIGTYIFHVPSVVTFHGTDVLENIASPWAKWAKRFAVLHASATTTGSRAAGLIVAKKYGVDPARFHVVYYALPPRAQSRATGDSSYNKKADDIIVLTVCNLVRRKGVDDIMRAVGMLQNPRMKLVVAGDGPERGALEKLAHELSLASQVCFVGRVADIEPLYLAADIFILASRYLEEEGDLEGLGIVLPEASQRGIPVIGTKSGGIPEAIVDGETGFLVPEGDTQAIAEKINILAEDPELRAEMGKKGKTFVAERFNPERAAREYISIYERIQP